MPDDLELGALEPRLHGAAFLAHSALNAPPPTMQAETKSRHLIEQLMQEAALSPKVLREAVREQPRRSWWQKLLTKGH